MKPLIIKGFHYGLKMLVRQARQKSLVMDPEASLLLKKYFVASRRARANDGVKGQKISEINCKVSIQQISLISVIVSKTDRFKK